MNHVAMLKRYLESRARSEPQPGTGLPFVTISRQAGAGGHTLARDIVREVERSLPGDLGQGWDVFDHKLCLLIAQDPEIGASFDGLLAERYRSEISITVEEMISGETRQYKAMKRIFEVVRALCTIGKVVIVGRAGSCVAADLPLHTRLRLVASRPTRIGNMMKLLDLDREAAARMVKKQDAERKRLLFDFFDQDIENPLLYDAVFNADAMSSPEMAKLAVQLMKQKLDAAR